MSGDGGGGGGESLGSAQIELCRTSLDARRMVTGDLTHSMRARALSDSGSRVYARVVEGLCAPGGKEEGVHVYIAAANLLGVSFLDGDTHPVACVHAKYPYDDAFTYVGRTELIRSHHDPVFLKPIHLPKSAADTTQLRVDVFHGHLATDEGGRGSPPGRGALIGSCLVLVGDLLENSVTARLQHRDRSKDASLATAGASVTVRVDDHRDLSTCAAPAIAAAAAHTAAIAPAVRHQQQLPSKIPKPSLAPASATKGLSMSSGFSRLPNAGTTSQSSLPTSPDSRQEKADGRQQTADDSLSSPNKAKIGSADSVSNVNSPRKPSLIRAGSSNSTSSSSSSSGRSKPLMGPVYTTNPLMAPAFTSKVPLFSTSNRSPTSELISPRLSRRTSREESREGGQEASREAYIDMSRDISREVPNRSESRIPLPSPRTHSSWKEKGGKEEKEMSRHDKLSPTGLSTQIPSPGQRKSVSEPPERRLLPSFVPNLRNSEYESAEDLRDSMDDSMNLVPEELLIDPVYDSPALHDERQDWQERQERQERQDSEQKVEAGSRLLENDDDEEGDEENEQKEKHMNGEREQQGESEEGEDVEELVRAEEKKSEEWRQRREAELQELKSRETERKKQRRQKAAQAQATSGSSSPTFEEEEQTRRTLDQEAKDASERLESERQEASEKLDEKERQESEKREARERQERGRRDQERLRAETEEARERQESEIREARERQEAELERAREEDDMMYETRWKEEEAMREKEEEKRNVARMEERRQEKEQREEERRREKQQRDEERLAALADDRQRQENEKLEAARREEQRKEAVERETAKRTKETEERETQQQWQEQTEREEREVERMEEERMERHREELDRLEREEADWQRTKAERVKARKREEREGEGKYWARTEERGRQRLQHEESFRTDQEKNAREANEASEAQQEEESREREVRDAQGSADKAEQELHAEMSRASSAMLQREESKGDKATGVKFTISCRNLIELDWQTPAFATNEDVCALVIVYERQPGDNFVPIGQTELSRNAENPRFKTVVTLVHATSATELYLAVFAQRRWEGGVFDYKRAKVVGCASLKAGDLGAVQQSGRVVKQLQVESDRYQNRELLDRGSFVVVHNVSEVPFPTSGRTGTGLKWSQWPDATPAAHLVSEEEEEEATATERLSFAVSCRGVVLDARNPPKVFFALYRKSKKSSKASTQFVGRTESVPGGDRIAFARALDDDVDADCTYQLQLYRRRRHRRIGTRGGGENLVFLDSITFSARDILPFTAQTSRACEFALDVPPGAVVSVTATRSLPGPSLASGANIAGQSPAQSLFPHHRWNEGGKAVAAKRNSLVSPRDALRATQVREKINDEAKAREVTEASRQGRREPPQARARFDDNIEAAGNSVGRGHKYGDVEHEIHKEEEGSEDEDGEAVERLALQLALAEAEEEVDLSRKRRSPRLKNDETRDRAERMVEKREHKSERDGRSSKSEKEGQSVAKDITRGGHPRDHHHRVAPETEAPETEEERQQRRRRRQQAARVDREGATFERETEEKLKRVAQGREDREGQGGQEERSLRREERDPERELTEHLRRGSRARDERKPGRELEELGRRSRERRASHPRSHSRREIAPEEGLNRVRSDRRQRFSRHRDSSAGSGNGGVAYDLHYVHSRKVWDDKGDHRNRHRSSHSEDYRSEALEKWRRGQQEQRDHGPFGSRGSDDLVDARLTDAIACRTTPYGSSLESLRNGGELDLMEMRGVLDAGRGARDESGARRGHDRGEGWSLVRG